MRSTNIFYHFEKILLQRTWCFALGYNYQIISYGMIQINVRFCLVSSDISIPCFEQMYACTFLEFKYDVGTS